MRDWCPYPGLAPFGEDHAHVFFGRSAHIEALIRKLETDRLVAVIGPSGAGKSSVMLAGVVPRLRVNLVPDLAATWRVESFRPGLDPLARLAQTLTRLEAATKERAQERSQDFEAMLQRNRAVLDQDIDGLAKRAFRLLAPEERLLLLVDQFEEVFRGADPQETEHFIQLLLRAAEDSSVRAHIVLTMRSEFLEACAAVPSLAEAINRASYLLPELRQEELAEVIEGPAHAVRLEVAPELLRAVVKSRRVDRVSLPVLQHALLRTWHMWHAESPGDRLELRHLRQAAGQDHATQEGDIALGSVMDAHGHMLLHSLAPDLRVVVEGLFRRLSFTDGSGRIVRRPTTVHDLVAEGVARDSVALERAVAPFRCRDAAFLQPLGDAPLADTTVVDVTHEAVFDGWSNASQWVEDERSDLSTLREVAGRARSNQQGKEGLLHGAGLTRLSQWWERQPSSRLEAWGRREPSVDVKLTLRYLRRSKLRRWLLRGVTAGALVALCSAGLNDVYVKAQAREEAAQAREEAALTRASVAQAREEGANLYMVRSTAMALTSLLGDRLPGLSEDPRIAWSFELCEKDCNPSRDTRVKFWAEGPNGTASSALAHLERVEWVGAKGNWDRQGRTEDVGNRQEGFPLVRYLFGCLTQPLELWPPPPRTAQAKMLASQMWCDGAFELLDQRTIPKPHRVRIRLLASDKTAVCRLEVRGHAAVAGDRTRPGQARSLLRRGKRLPAGRFCEVWGARREAMSVSYSLCGDPEPRHERYYLRGFPTQVSGGSTLVIDLREPGSRQGGIPPARVESASRQWLEGYEKLGKNDPDGARAAFQAATKTYQYFPWANLWLALPKPWGTGSEPEQVPTYARRMSLGGAEAEVRTLEQVLGKDFDATEKREWAAADACVPIDAKE